MMASLPRIEVTAAVLRSIVSDGMAETINLYRAARRQNGYQGDTNSSEPTEQEIDDFLFSNPMLDTETVQHLTDEGLLGYSANTGKASDDWLGEFRSRVESWASSNSWLGGNAPLVHVERIFGGIETDVWTPSEGRPPGWVESSPSYMLLAADILRRGRLLSELSWRDFEKLVGELLEAEGWTVQVTQPSRDGGVDIIAEKLDAITGVLRTLWQAKKYRVARKVKLHEVRELSAIIDFERATKGFIVTTSHLTADALRWVKRDLFRLGYHDKEEMERWVRLRVFGPES